MTENNSDLPQGIPLKDITCSQPVHYEIGKGWYRVVAEGKITARVVHPTDAFLCRLEPTRWEAPLGGYDVVQLSIGRVRSLLADSVFSPSEDLGLKFTGKNLCLDWDERSNQYLASAEGSLTVSEREHVYRDGYKLKWYKPLDKTYFSRAPAGWFAWYYCIINHLNNDERDVLRNLEWLKNNLAPFGLEYVQMDDGWQGKGRDCGSNRDWFVTCSEKFPHGMKWLADEIRKAKLVPGIWLVPFAQSDAQLHSKNPKMFLHEDDGRSIGELPAPLTEWMEAEDDRKYEWLGRYVLDPTNPDTLEYLKRLFRMLCEEWGYKYVKIDGQGGMSAIYNKYRQKLVDATKTGDEVYRLGLEVIREEMGKERFLLNCLQGFDGPGLCEGIRIGMDVASNSVEGLERAADSTMQLLYLNSIVWWTDPDAILLSSPLGLEQARAWVTLVGITGQMLMTGDEMPELEAERVELLKRIYPVADIRPMELYPLWGNPSIFDLKVNKPGVGEWDVVAVFNWSRTWKKTGSLSTRTLGIPPSENGFIFYDVWKEQVHASGKDTLEIDVPPMECCVFSIRNLEHRPQVIGTSRHLTQGADDLEEVHWDNTSATLSGRSRVVSADPYRIHFTIPEGWELFGNEAITVEAGHGVLTLNSATNEKLSWQVRFKKTNDDE